MLIAKIFLIWLIVLIVLRVILFFCQIVDNSFYNTKYYKDNTAVGVLYQFVRIFGIIFWAIYISIRFISWFLKL